MPNKKPGDGVPPGINLPGDKPPAGIIKSSETTSLLRGEAAQK